MSSSRPSGLIATKGIELLTFGTPNGQKVSILLEELKEAYGKDYTYQSIHIGENIQKEPWFTALNPNGRIPVVVDHDRNDFAVFEGGAILFYLTRHYDPQNKFCAKNDEDDYSRTEQWVTWLQSGLAPMQGQANHFYRLAKERIPYPTQRYVGETERLMGILDHRLEGRDYIIGPGKGQYSIADIACFSWTNWGFFSGVDPKSFKNLWAWLERINARPAVQKGTSIPSESANTNPAFEKKMESDSEFAAKQKELKDLLNKAKEQYNYKYASP